MVVGRECGVEEGVDGRWKDCEGKGMGVGKWKGVELVIVAKTSPFLPLSHDTSCVVDFMALQEEDYVL